MRNGLGYYMPIPPPRRVRVTGFSRPPEPASAVAAALDPFPQQGYADPLDSAPGKIEISRLPISNFMPKEGQDFRFTGGVDIPAIGASAVVVQFKVPQGYNGILDLLSNVYIGGGFTDFSGAVIWQLFLDYQTGGGIVAPNYDSITASLGSATNPAKLHGIFIKENQLVTLIVTNVSIVVAGQRSGGLLGGYFYPVDQEPPDQSF